MELARQAVRLVIAREIRVVIDRDSTRRVWKPDAHRAAIIGRFDQSFSLYRIFDGEELRRVARTGYFIGGTYSVPMERQYGASWGENISEIIQWGNRQRGQRLGDDLFLAKIDALDKRFFHLHAYGVPFDPAGPEEQPVTIEASLCSTGLGCSVVDAKFDDATIYRVEPSGQITQMSNADVDAYLKSKPEKAIELRKVSPVYYSGRIHGEDVQVSLHQENDAFYQTWSVSLRDDQDIIVIGAKTMEAAVKKAEQLIKASLHSRHNPANLLPKRTLTQWKKMHPSEPAFTRPRYATAVKVAARFIESKSYFEIGDIVLMGKYKNKRGKIVAFGTDKWGNPTVEVEPIPKGRKQNKVFGLYKIWRADVKENALKKMEAEGK